MSNSITQLEEKKQAPIQWRTNEAAALAAVELWNNCEEIASRMQKKHPQIKDELLQRAIALAPIVFFEGDDELITSGERIASVNGYAIKTATRGGQYFSSPREWITTTCDCKSYQFKTGTATIEKPAAWEVSPRHPKTTKHTVCKHIAAVAIKRKLDEERAKAAAEHEAAAAADLFAKAISPPPPPPAAIIEGMYYTTSRTDAHGITHYTESRTRTGGKSRVIKRPPLTPAREWTTYKKHKPTPTTPTRKTP